MENKVKEQLVKDNYAIYNGDCMDVLPILPVQVKRTLVIVRVKNNF